MDADRADDLDRDFSEFLGANVPPSLYDRVRVAARRTDRTVSSWLRQAVRAQLDENHATADEPTAPVQ